MINRKQLIKEQKEHPLSQRDFLVQKLGKKLSDSEETIESYYIQIDKKQYLSYRWLAMKYWPEEFTSGIKIVHHINGNHYDHRVCNLVVLTPKEHILVHELFFGDSPYKKNYCDGTKWMTNDKDEMMVIPPWDRDMLIFGWRYGMRKRKTS